MRRLLIGCALVVLAIALSGCHDRTSYSPTSPVSSASPEPEWATASVQREFTLERGSRGDLIGPWRGASAISVALGAPECSTGAWPVEQSQELRAEILLLEDGSLDLHLVIPDESEEICHLELIVDGSKLRAAPWTDYFGESFSCHYPIPISAWSCNPAVTEVWIVGLQLEGSLENRDRRIRGSLSARYDYR
jgi:hypothetical protein